MLVVVLLHVCLYAYMNVHSSFACLHETVYTYTGLIFLFLAPIPYFMAGFPGAGFPYIILNCWVVCAYAYFIRRII